MWIFNINNSGLMSHGEHISNDSSFKAIFAPFWFYPYSNLV